MIDNKSFREYCDKRFDQDDEVIVFGLGPTIKGEFEATIRGVHGIEPHESYIVEWKNPKKMKKFYRPTKSWTHCVLSKAHLMKV